ncbi:MAG: TIR domain-containing protein [Dehalococcoidia bacterium]
MKYLESLVEHMNRVITPEMAGHQLEMAYKLDVTHLCPRVKAPTLVVHRRGDKYIAFKAGLELASLIPNARFVPLEGNIHVNFLGDTKSYLNNVFEFLGDPIIDDKATKAVRPTTKKSVHDVFISFAFEDKEYASKIYAHLKDSGICPFWCEDVTAGGDYPQLLGEAIRDSKAFLLVLSDSSDNSATVRKETTIAHNNKKTIIPVRVKNIMPKNLEYLIANSLFFDAFPQPLEQHLPKLTSDIKKIVGGKADKKRR